MNAPYIFLRFCEHLLFRADFVYVEFVGLDFQFSYRRHVCSFLTYKHYSAHNV
jgi:hypothetical protein